MNIPDSLKHHKTRAAVLVGACMVLLTACPSSAHKVDNSAQSKAITTAQTRQNYTPVNDLEGKNYNARQKLADNPATIIWCSVYPTNPNVKPFTVPIVGKLTSGNKRPYPTSIVYNYYQDSGSYNPELPGSDGFYGTSGEYRYGFDPAGNYHDFYGLEVYCTSEPTLIQKNTTDIQVTTNEATDPKIKAAQDALAKCRAADPDPSKPCPAAVTALAG